MNRRNFIGSLLAIGAGFSILPPATTYGRIWTVEKKVIVPDREVRSIWQTHYMSWVQTVPDRLPEQPIGSLHRAGRELFYRYHGGWVKLEKLSRPLPWRGAVHIPTENLGKKTSAIPMNSCWSREPCSVAVVGQLVDGIVDEYVKIPNILAYDSNPEGLGPSKTLFVDVDTGKQFTV